MAFNRRMFTRRLPADNFPDDYERRAYRQYRPWMRPGVLAWLVLNLPRLGFLLLMVMVLIFGLGITWLVLPPAEPRIVVVPPATLDAPTPVSDVTGDYPAAVPQSFIQVPARVDHTLPANTRHGYRFFLRPGFTWTITLYVVESLSPVMSLYDPQGILLDLQSALGANRSLTITYTPGAEGQYALLIEGAGGSSGGYTLAISGRAN